MTPPEPAAKPRRRARPAPIALVTDPAEAARAADLVYMTDDAPGITREKRGRGFSYRAPDGSPVRDAAVLARIAALAIPPGYREVWISPNPDSHVQATGRDERGRKQYRYHARWEAQREATKFDRMILFGEALPRLRAGLAADLARRGLPREKVLAAVVSLLGKTFIRIGSAEYARTNESYGLTTLKDEHARIDDGTVAFTFRGKSGKDHAVTLHDKRLARIVRGCQELPGQHLFQYLDENREPRAVTSADVNDYLRGLAGEAFTAKDFRTWGGTTLAVLACVALGECAAEPTAREARRVTTAVIREVAAKLGNTPSVCRKYYVHPAIAETYLAGKLLALYAAEAARGETPDAHDLEAAERVVLAVLRAARETAAPERA
jgi:DNA topoisomerase-1